MTPKPPGNTATQTFSLTGRRHGRGTQNVANLGFHAAASTLGALLQTALHGLIQVPNDDLRHVSMISRYQRMP
jgi:hypothetical protein